MTRTATLAVDVGGTFTDVTLLAADGRSYSTKVLSNRDHPERSLTAAISLVTKEAVLEPREIGRVVHATTLATNCVIEQTGPAVGLVTTRGFRHVLEIGRHDGPRRSSMLTWRKPARPIPASRVFEIDERLAGDGTVVRALDVEACRTLGRVLRDLGIDSVAISFINSYASAAHEEEAATQIKLVHPQAKISLSSDVLPAMREYERSLAAGLNAYVMPVVEDYLGKVEGVLDVDGARVPAFVMQSNGGQVSAGEARRRPIALILSGPAAGAMGAAHVARRGNIRRAISIDMGGTSTDVCVLHGGEPGSTEEAHVGPWPFAVPSVEVHTIGAGGGSLARVAADGTIAVGPESAGADPGPACYGAGGTRPTVTDCNLVLGRLPLRIGAGQISLNLEAAKEAVSQHLAEPLGTDIETAAAGVVDVLNASTAAAIRMLTTQRGRDPRDYVLIAAGGAGPLHAAEVCRLLGGSRIVVPPNPGVNSTIGLLQSPLRRDFVTTYVVPIKRCEAAATESAFRALEDEATRWFVREGVPERNRRTNRTVAAHFVDQVGSVSFDWSGVEALEEGLNRAHMELFGFVPREQHGELLALRVVARSTRRPTRIVAGGSGSRKHPTRQAVFVDRTARTTTCDVYDRASLSSAEVFSGPAIVEQMDSTTYVPPGFQFSIDRSRNLVLKHE